MGIILLYLSKNVGEYGAELSIRQGANPKKQKKTRVSTHIFAFNHSLVQRPPIKACEKFHKLLVS
ncbi:MAG: hypothetical protein CMO79_08525 [Verrucomicrobiales bacterium]|nr:hypothetical protein [Verrucomicrobiales bacterium]